MKYELRHFFMTNVIKKEYVTNDYVLKKLDQKILQEYNALELGLLNNMLFAKAYILYIKMTKIIWRLKGYERVK